MAVTGTQLYNKDKQKIYPFSYATIINSEASGTLETVETNLKNLWKAISELTGDAEASENIIVKVNYAFSNSSNVNEIANSASWSDTFELPTNGEIYIWKKTEFSYKGNTDDANTIYEIVYADLAERTQTIYKATSTGVAPKIEYPVLTDGYGEPILDDDGNEQEDLTAFDDKLPDGWLETPVSITPATPYVFMAVRKRIEGVWERYSEPAQFGRWAFDSQLELRYTYTEDGSVPEFTADADNPGDIWSVTAPTDFTGKLWMITATSVNGVINADSEGIRWRGPNLMSIIE